MKKKQKVLVFGAAGRMGLSFSVLMAKQGYDVLGIDIDPNMIEQLNLGQNIPYEEPDLLFELDDAVNGTKNLHFGKWNNAYVETWLEPAIKLPPPGSFEAMTGNSITNESVKPPHHIVIFVGTHLREGKKDLSAVHSVVADIMELDKDIVDNSIIYLRSTVEPGTTKKIQQTLNAADLTPKVIYWPERMAEGHVLEEHDQFPQIVGVDEYVNFHATLLKDNEHEQRVHKLTTEEAEFAKVASNTVRYGEFALINYMQFLADAHGYDFAKIFKALSHEYPRFNYPAPGPNVGGPCLSKDYHYIKDLQPTDKHSLFDAVNYTNTQLTLDMICDKVELVKGLLGESWPSLEILILGAGFKQDSDNPLNSATIPLCSRLEEMGHAVEIYDPHVKMVKWDNSNGQVWLKTLERIEYPESYDIIITMTPHSEFKQSTYRFLANQGSEDGYFINYWRVFEKTTKIFPKDVTKLTTVRKYYNG